MIENQKKISPLKQALIAVEDMQRKIVNLEKNKNEPIAIIGLSGRFPKCESIDKFWELLLNNEDGISEIPNDRWDKEKFYSPIPNTPGKMISKFGGFISDFDKFDPQFFGISPRETQKMDPQQRLLLEVAWEALEDSSIKASEIAESKTGVFIGISNNDYSFVQLDNGNYDLKLIDAYQGSGNASSIAANRLSYFLNFKGPSLAIDTACSSSLVSIHLACQSLQNKECNLALAGGVNLILSPHASITFSQANMLSPDGKCKSFDANANGYVRGEGVGIVVLKRLSDALNDKDNILAIIKGTAINQDGKTNGLTAPNTFSQVEVIKKAIEKAQITPDEIGYIETHGTGTILGDPIEVQAILNVMKNRKSINPLYLGAVKTNIGHLESAAGIAGLIKTILVLKNKLIPANINFTKLNPHIEIDETKIKIPTKNISWKNSTSKRYAGISSFGFGGTNAHIILEEPPEKMLVSDNKIPPVNIFCLSAADQNSLRNLAVKFYDHLTKNPELPLLDASYTVNNFREFFHERAAVLYGSRKELLEKLTDLSTGKSSYNLFKKNFQFGNSKKVSFLFTGQGSQYFEMSKELYENLPVFKEALDSCINYSKEYLSISLDKILFERDYQLLVDDTEFTQTAIFAIEYALAKLWLSFNIHPDFLIGHSIGEYAAACIADVFSLSDAIKLTALRGKLMQSLPKNGSMVAVFTSKDKIENLIINSGNNNYISIAGDNGPTNTVISGETEKIESFLTLLDEINVGYSKLKVSHAFHSHLMDPILDEFEREAAKIDFKPLKYNFISNLTGNLVSKGQILDSKYWCDHIRNTVNFFDGMKTLNNFQCEIFLEIGPNPILTGMGRQCIPQNSGLWTYSLKRNESNLNSILSSLAVLFVNGFDVNFRNFYTAYSPQRIQLPTYAFRKERYYIDKNSSGLLVSNQNFNNNLNLKCLIKKDKEKGLHSIKIYDTSNNLVLKLSKIKLEEEKEELNEIDQNNHELFENNIRKIDLEENKFNFEHFNSLNDNIKKDYLSNFITTEISQVLKLSPERIDTNKSILHLGLDSIMAIELKNRLESNFKVDIAIKHFLEGLSIGKLSDFILKEFPKQNKQTIIKDKFKLTNKYTLSQGQNAMWFQHKYAPDSIYNPTYAAKILSKIDIQRLKDVIEKIVDRHESLRTIYSYENGNLLQIIQDKIDTPFYSHSCTDMSDSQIREKVNEIANHKFDLEKGPLFEIHLFKIDELEYILLLKAHHIAVDFWSQAIIVDEIGLLYGSENNLPKLEYSYLDYVDWQTEFLKSKICENHINFWKGKLNGELPTLDLPPFSKRKGVQTFNGNSITKTFNKELTESLHKLSQKKDVTLYVLLLSSFYVLLNKYTHQNDIIIGTPFSGRSSSKFKNLVGYFVNPLPVRQNLSTQLTISQLIENVKNDVLEIFEHQDYPFNLIVENIQTYRDIKRTPIFQVMFVYQKAHLLAKEGLSGFAVGKQNSFMNLGGLTINNYSLETTKSIFDLTLTIAESENELTASFIYNTDLFKESFIDEFASNYQKILKIIVQNSEQKLSYITLNEQKIKANYDFNELKNKLKLVHSEFEEKAIQYPDKIAVKLKNKKITYSELNKKANQLANYLIEQGAKVETKIGVYLDRSIEMIESIIAILKAGCVYVPIDTILPAERIYNIISDANIKFVISNSVDCKKIQDQDVDIIYIDSIYKGLEDFSSQNINLTIDQQNLAYSIYTSGSTGLPKGVMLTHLGLSNLVKNQTKYFEITSESKILQFASVSFDASISEIFTALVNGATLNLISKEILLSGSALINEINNEKITVITLPPSLLSVLPYNQLESLITLVSAGEQCTKEIVKKWGNNRRFINAYGPTEITVCATCNVITNFDNGDNVPIGKNIEGMEVFILDKNMQQVPKGVKGELYISGIGLARGYNNLPALTAEKFLPNPFDNITGSRLYKTGDLVIEKENGNIEFLGRADDQIKFRGFRIELKEIKSVLDEHENIIKSEILLVNDFKGENKLVAYYLSKNDEEISKNIFREYLNEHLPEYMLPTHFIKLREFPLTTNGKVDKKALEKIPLETNKDFIPDIPRNEIESTLLEIWKEILGIEKIKLTDNFFDLGGHSLNIIKVQIKIKEKFNKECEIIDLFKYPTIELFAKFLVNGSLKSNSVQEKIDRIEKQKNFISQRAKTILRNKN